jgi:hypothetical protein
LFSIPLVPLHRGSKIHVATVRLQVVATTKLAAPIGGEVKVMIREDNQPDGDTPGAISAGAYPKP